MNSNFLFLTRGRNKKIKIKRTLHNINRIHNNNNNIHNLSLNKNKWIVILTTAVNINNESEYRKKLYKKQISNWLRYTNHYIYVIESTGVYLNITHERLKYVSFYLPKLASSSQSEAVSIPHILNNIKNIFLYTFYIFFDMIELNTYHLTYH